MLNISCHDLILSCLFHISWLFISDSFLPPSCVFRMTFICILAVIKASMTYPCLWITFMGSRNILLSPSTLLCKYWQVNSRVCVFQRDYFPKWKMRGLCSRKLDFERLVEGHRVSWEGRKGLVLANSSGLWACSYDLSIRIWFGLVRRGRFMAFVGDRLSRQIWKPFWLSNKQMLNIACFIIS